MIETNAIRFCQRLIGIKVLVECSDGGQRRIGKVAAVKNTVLGNKRLKARHFRRAAGEGCIKIEVLQFRKDRIGRGGVRPGLCCEFRKTMGGVTVDSRRHERGSYRTFG